MCVLLNYLKKEKTKEKKEKKFKELKTRRIPTKDMKQNCSFKLSKADSTNKYKIWEMVPG